MFSTCKHGCVRRYPKPSGDFRVAIWGYDSRISYPPVNRHSIFCERCRSDLIRCDRMGSHAIACDRMGSQTLCRQLSEFLKMHREREVGQKVCQSVSSRQLWTDFIYYFFRLSQKGRNEKRDSFYTAKRVSSVHSCRDETRLAVFSVPFPQNKFRTCLFQPTRSECNSSVCKSVRRIERKMAHAQQIRSIILQNHESTWIVNQ